MVAGQGFKDFVVGEVLTSSDVDGFLMQQSVMRFADDGARGSALGTAVGTAVPLAEGMVAYLDDVDQVQVYDGAAWKALGGLVAVKSALFTGTQTNSTASGANFAVTDLSITHEVADAANRLIISAFFGAAASSEGDGRVGIAINDGSGLIAVGATAGNRNSLTAGGQVATTASDRVVAMPSVTFVHTPGAGSKTYTVRAVNVTDATRTVYINRSEGDANNASRPRAVSSLVIQEVRV
jgi:hypothetical protein